ncbi:MAG: 4Fe-4S double cluster binding domain-containing protein [Lentisphaeria bacterium]|nr:4Fe-4S double cluster binding domain-containing protein [Lentisphaeria bacterium]
MRESGLKQAVKDLAAACGYVACGITGAEPFAADREAVGLRIRQFPEAAELYQRFMNRADPRRTAPWCGSVVVCIRWYGKYDLPETLVGHIGRHYLADCRLEACPDYAMAKNMTGGLRALGLRCKKGGVPDRWAAARAGVARVANNCFAYSEGYGSWINIQTWRIDADLEPDEPTLESPCPPGCRACLNACPTGAIKSARCMRMDECVAYLSYSAPFPIDRRLWHKMGEWIYGCDVCQTACPLNDGKWKKTEKNPWLTPVIDTLTPAALAVMDDETYRHSVHPLFWYIPADDPERWRANARRAVNLMAAKNKK